MTSLVCIFSLLVLVSCLRVQLSHQARRQQRQSTSPAHVARPRPLPLTSAMYSL
jgi:hypothetical protein